MSTVAFPKEGRVTRKASFPRYHSRSKNTIFLLSAARSIANLLNLVAFRANFIWPSFGNTTVCIIMRTQGHACASFPGCGSNMQSLAADEPNPNSRPTLTSPPVIAPTPAFVTSAVVPFESRFRRNSINLDILREQWKAMQRMVKNCIATSL
jgi:hypothetical protein